MMIAKLVDIGLYKGYLYLIKYIYTDINETNYFREIFEGTDIANDWYNGYVILPKEHELVDKFYGDFEEDYDLKVHGGITFSDYYKANGLEAFDVIDSFELNFNLGNAFKYIARAGKKGDKVEDLRKAITYLNREIGKCQGIANIEQ
jgi:hypothetical protein